MKKLFLGLISLLLAGQVSFAQPVSDQAVIPMGITIQSVMRLTITRGGNMEFVFKSASDIANGVPSAWSSAYQTDGNISASTNWDLELMADAGNFSTNIPLNVIEYNVTTSPANTIAGGGTNPGPLPTNLNTNPFDLLTQDTGAGGGDNYGDGLSFTVQWACGANIAGGAVIPANAAPGRYAVNFILTLVPH